MSQQISLQDWFMKRGFYLKQAADSARAIDLEASRYLSTASEIAFWNADSINRVLLYEAEGCVEIDTVSDNAPVITSIEEADLDGDQIDGKLLSKLGKIGSYRLKASAVMKNVSMPEEDFRNFVYPAMGAGVWAIPGLVAAAANRVWIRLLNRRGLPVPAKPAIPYPANITADKFEDYHLEPEIFCPVCGSVYYTFVVILKDGSREYTQFDDDWQCFGCQSGFNAMTPYPRYQRVF